MSNEKLGKGEILIDGHIHKLKPLTTEDLPHFLRVAKCFSHLKEGSPIEETFSHLDDAGAKSLQHIIDKTLERSMPTVPEDARKELGLRHFMEIISAVFEISLPQSHEAQKKAELLVK